MPWTLTKSSASSSSEGGASEEHGKRKEVEVQAKCVVDVTAYWEALRLIRAFAVPRQSLWVSFSGDGPGKHFDVYLVEVVSSLTTVGVVLRQACEQHQFSGARKDRQQKFCGLRRVHAPPNSPTPNQRNKLPLTQCAAAAEVEAAANSAVVKDTLKVDLGLSAAAALEHGCILMAVPVTCSQLAKLKEKMEKGKKRAAAAAAKQKMLEEGSGGEGEGEEQEEETVEVSVWIGRRSRYPIQVPLSQPIRVALTEAVEAYLIEYDYDDPGVCGLQVIKGRGKDGVNLDLEMLAGEAVGHGDELKAVNYTIRSKVRELREEQERKKAQEEQEQAEKDEEEQETAEQEEETVEKEEQEEEESTANEEEKVLSIEVPVAAEVEGAVAEEVTAPHASCPSPATDGDVPDVLTDAEMVALGLMSAPKEKSILVEDMDKEEEEKEEEAEEVGVDVGGSSDRSTTAGEEEQEEGGADASPDSGTTGGEGGQEEDAPPPSTAGEEEQQEDASPSSPHPVPPKSPTFLDKARAFFGMTDDEEEADATQPAAAPAAGAEGGDGVEEGSEDEEGMQKEGQSEAAGGGGEEVKDVDETMEKKGEDGDGQKKGEGTAEKAGDEDLKKKAAGKVESASVMGGIFSKDKTQTTSKSSSSRGGSPGQASFVPLRDIFCKLDEAAGHYRHKALAGSLAPSLFTVKCIEDPMGTHSPPIHADLLVDSSRVRIVSEPSEQNGGRELKGWAFEELDGWVVDPPKSTLELRVRGVERSYIFVVEDLSLAVLTMQEGVFRFIRDRRHCGLPSLQQQEEQLLQQQQGQQANGVGTKTRRKRKSSFGGGFLETIVEEDDEGGEEGMRHGEETHDVEGFFRVGVIAGPDTLPVRAKLLITETIIGLYSDEDLSITSTSSSSSSGTSSSTTANKADGSGLGMGGGGGLGGRSMTSCWPCYALHTFTVVGEEVLLSIYEEDTQAPSHGSVQQHLNSQRRWRDEDNSNYFVSEGKEQGGLASSSSSSSSSGGGSSHMGYSGGAANKSTSLWLRVQTPREALCIQKRLKTAQSNSFGGATSGRR